MKTRLARMGKLAFYNSMVNSIILHQDYMIIPIDDKIIGRGYAVHTSINYHNNVNAITPILQSFYQSSIAINLIPPHNIPLLQGFYTNRYLKTTS